MLRKLQIIVNLFQRDRQINRLQHQGFVALKTFELPIVGILPIAFHLQGMFQLLVMGFLCTTHAQVDLGL